MQINNIRVIDNKLKCNKVVADYLVSIGFQPISKSDKSYYFKKNDDILQKYSNAPFYIKAFGKVVEE